MQTCSFLNKLYCSRGWFGTYKETAPTTFSVDLELKNFCIVKRNTKQPRRLVQQEVHTTLKTVVEERVPSLFLSWSHLEELFSLHNWLAHPRIFVHSAHICSRVRMLSSCNALRPWTINLAALPKTWQILWSVLRDHGQFLRTNPYSLVLVNGFSVCPRCMPGLLPQ